MLTGKKHISLLTILAVLSAFCLSCNGDYEFNGDLVKELNEDVQTDIYFKKDAASPIAFSLPYKMGVDYKVSDLPGNKDPNVSKLNPGYDVVGWIPELTSGDADKCIKVDAEGKLLSFHVTTTELIVYPAAYVPSHDTPYTVNHHIQNKSLTGYEFYKKEKKKGTTSTPSAISYTDGSSAVLNIPGFSLSTVNAIHDMEILADGTTVIDIFYDRIQYALTFDGNGDDSSGSYDQDFYYDVPAALMGNAFIRTGYVFAGWAKTKERADQLKVDYEDGAMYTIGTSDVTLYAVWKLPAISVFIELPSIDEVGITYTINGNEITFTAAIPEGHTAAEYNFYWYKPGEPIAGLPAEQKGESWLVDTTGWEPGVYEISLLAVHNIDSMPSGQTVQITITP